MPNAHRHPAASLRTSRSIPADILRSTKIDENLRVRPDVARQYAVAAANRAFQMSIAAKSAGAREYRPPMDGHRARTMTNRRRQSSTDETLVDGLTPAYTDPTACTTPSHVDPPGSETSEGTMLAGDRQSHITALPEIRQPSGPASSFQRAGRTKLRSTLRTPTPSAKSTPSRGRPALGHVSAFQASPSVNAYPTGLSPGRAVPTAGELLQRLPNPYQTTYNQDLAVQMARDEYIRQIEAQQAQAQHQPRLENGDQPKLIKSLRRTLRNISNPSANWSDDLGQHPNLTKAEGNSRGRRISQSVKTTLKRLFGGGSAQNFPLQHVNAKRQHYTENDDALDPIRNPIIPTPPPELVARMSARPSSDTFMEPPVVDSGTRTPSLHTHGSRESLRTRSRVTSWSDSVTSRGTYQPPTGESQAAERSRLSIIQENATHQPSVSASQRHRSHGYAAFEKPLRRGGLSDPAETEKMLSELQQQLQRRSQASTADASEDSGSELVDLGPHPSYRRPQSRDSASRYDFVRSSIRPVKYDSTEVKTLPRKSHSLKRGRMRISATPDDDVFESTHSRALRQRHSYARLQHKLSLQEMADLNEAHAAKKRASLRETRSTFFPSKGQYPDHWMSPWQLARKAQMEQAARKINRARQWSHSSPESQESGSVYSRKTSSTPTTNSIFEQTQKATDEPTGTAWIIESKPAIDHYRSLVSRTYQPARVTSHRSSGSWKGWMTSEVSKLEGPDDYNVGIQLPQDLPGMRGVGHVREDAQHDTIPESEQKRSFSGAKQAMEVVRKISGLRLPKANEAKHGESRETSSGTGSQERAAMQKIRAMVPALRIQQDENKRIGSETSTTAAPPKAPAHKFSEPRLPLLAAPESPMTPFTKFMASDTSPLAGYELRERSGNKSNANHSTEREARLRRMKSSILASNKPRPQGPNQYPWLQRYRDSHFTEEFSPVDTNRYRKAPEVGFEDDRNKENTPDSYDGSDDLERFPTADPRAELAFV